MIGLGSDKNRQQMQRSQYKGERSSSWVTNYLILILIIFIIVNNAIIITIPINLIIMVTTVKSRPREKTSTGPSALVSER